MERTKPLSNKERRKIAAFEVCGLSNIASIKEEWHLGMIFLGLGYCKILILFLRTNKKFNLKTFAYTNPSEHDVFFQRFSIEHIGKKGTGRIIDQR